MTPPPPPVPTTTTPEPPKDVPRPATAAAKQPDSKKPSAEPKKRAQLILPPDAKDSSTTTNLSDLDVGGSHKEKMTNAEHEKMLEKQVAEEIEKGHMEKKDNFKLLHYEDPRIIQLKMADVRLNIPVLDHFCFFCFSILSKTYLFFLQNVKDMYALADDIIIGDLKKK